MARGIGLSAACYAALLALANAGVGVRDGAPTIGTLALALLLILAPAGLAIPAGQALGAPLWAWETIVSWAALGALVLLVEPSGLGRGLALGLLLPPFFGACASPALLLAAWRAPERASALRHCGYGVAAFPAGLLLLELFGALNAITALLFALIFVAGSFVVSLVGASAVASATDEDAPPAEPAPEPASADMPRPALRPVVTLLARAHGE